MPQPLIALVFLLGLAFLVGLFIYIGTDSEKTKRNSGSLLGLGLVLAAILSIVEYGVPQAIDLRGGSAFTVRLQPGLNPDTGEPKPIAPNAITQVSDVLRDRLDPSGDRNVEIIPLGSDQLRITIPAVTDEERQQVRDTLRRTAQLEFRLVAEQHSPDRALAVYEGREILPGFTAIPYAEGEGPIARSRKELATLDPDAAAAAADLPQEFLLVSDRVDLPGTNVTRSNPMPDVGVGWAVNLNFDNEGRQLFGRLSSENVGRQFAIIIDGEVHSAPVIREAMWGGSCSISGSAADPFSQEQATTLATILNNPLENAMSIEDESSISPTYGAATIRQGITAGIIGLGITLALMMFYYRIAGIIALAGLSANIAILFGAISLFQSPVSMAGIAGIVLTIGMAVDANVLIFERLREELAAGKSLKSAIQAAYEKAFSAIFDANITTLITAAILFMLASDRVKGFAVTLSIGILASLFAALVITRVCFLWTAGTSIKTLNFSNILPNRTFDFLRFWKRSAIISGVLIVVAIATLAGRNVNTLGIEFRSGSETSLTVADGAELSRDEVEAALKDARISATAEDGSLQDLGPIGNTSIQRQTSAAGDVTFIIRGEFEAGEAIESTLTSALADKIAGSKTESTGPAFGQRQAFDALLALGLGVLAILAYITIRFEFSFAVGAIIALVHDLVICIGLMALIGIFDGTQISLIHIGAFLTIAGYSINDTIVVFDRIREDLKTKRGEIADVMNLAISTTLRRTVITSVTTLITVTTLAIFGGPSLREFSETIILGLFVGTYSSIFIAAPLVLWFAKRQGTNLRHELLDADDDIPSPAATTPSA
jgi:SecD/SecF fusion protein